jgi:alkylated DNA repair protein alkB family protein 1
MNSTLDAYEKPPEHIRAVYKKYQKIKGLNLDSDTEVLDLRNQDANKYPNLLNKVGIISQDQIFRACAAIESDNVKSKLRDGIKANITDCSVFEHKHLLGKLGLYPAVLLFFRTSQCIMIWISLSRQRITYHPWSSSR